jgi:hypothetical protein
MLIRQILVELRHGQLIYPTLFYLCFHIIADETILRTQFQELLSSVQIKLQILRINRFR